MSHRIGVVGASGYGGAELLRLADAHPAIDIEVVAAHSQAGQPVAQLFPNLPGERTFDPIDLDTLADLDLVVLATPHGVALELGAALYDAGTPVIDLSAAFRLDPAGFATWYGEQHPRADLCAAGAASASDVAYGLPERFRDRIAGALLVANPGCYPTATLLALSPLAALTVPGTVVVDAKSGTSGAGRAAKDNLHFAHVHGDLTAYGAPTHRHTGEIETWLPGGSGASTVDAATAAGGDVAGTAAGPAAGAATRAAPGPISFTPHLVPMSRGLFTTAYAQLSDGVTGDDVHHALHDAYDDEPFVHVLAPGTFPHTKALAGSNGCQLSALVDERTRRVVVTAAIDNLGKGAAGQAVQNANLLLGEEETLGLSTIGVYP